MSRFWIALSVMLLFRSLAVSQNPPTSDPQALTAAAKSIAALTSGNVVTDVSILGTVTSFAGSDIETGTATLLGRGTSESKIVLSVKDGTKTEIRNAANGSPQGKWLNPDGTSGLSAWHNCQTDAIWFFPELSSLANFSSTGFIFSNVGQESWNGLSAQHLRIYQAWPAATPLRIQNLGAIDFYLDPVSFLPLAVDFSIHPDNDTKTSIPEEVRFANYQLVDKIQIPFHVQRLINGGLSLDIVVTSATVNSGLNDSQFDF
jgi:hypothetical protein